MENWNVGAAQDGLRGRHGQSATLLAKEALKCEVETVRQGFKTIDFKFDQCLCFFKYSSEIREMQTNVKAQLLIVKPAITLSVQFGVNGANGVNV